MFYKIIINTLLITCLVITQISFIYSLPFGLNNLNLILVILIFILVLVNLKFAVWWAIGAGLLLDMFSFAVFGVYLACLSVTILLAHFLLAHFFTNRSLYSFFALTSLATLFYNILLTFIIYLVQLIGAREVHLILNKNFWLIQLSQLGLNLLATLIIFYCVSFISKRLSPVFLIKRR